MGEKIETNYYESKKLAQCFITKLESEIKFPPKTKYSSHRVKKGETIYTLCKRYGLDHNEIRVLNGIPFDSDYIGEGTILNIAIFEKPQSQRTSIIKKITNSKVVKHSVKRGETLTKIAFNYGTTTRSIKDLNRLRGDRIFLGQTLKIKTSKSLSDVASKTKSSSNKSNRKKIYHKVRRGEAISTIADKYGVSTSDIRRWNPSKVKGSKIFYGTRLVIHPGKSSRSSAPKYYRVAHGDTLTSIARKFGISLNTLKNRNQSINPNRLKVGQKIRIQ